MSRQRPMKGYLVSLAGAAVVLGVVFAGPKLFGFADKLPAVGSQESQESQAEGNGPWKVGDCGGPDPEAGADGFQMLGCDDSEATMKALAIKDGSLIGEVQCPGGTDLIIEVTITYGSGSSGIPTQTVCGRNLSDDHPGDPGKGGGQLVKGDCVNAESLEEVDCASGAEGLTKVLDLTPTVEECPAQTTEPFELTPETGRPYDAICGGAV